MTITSEQKVTMSDHVEVAYKGDPVEKDGRLVAVKIRRQEFRAPRSSNGSVSRLRGKYTYGPTLEVPVTETSLLVKELVSWLEYFASSASDNDRK
jgi:hypothetical protein